MIEFTLVQNILFLWSWGRNGVDPDARGLALARLTHLAQHESVAHTCTLWYTRVDRKKKIFHSFWWLVGASAWSFLFGSYSDIFVI